MIDVLLITNPAELEKAFAIRREVFVEEQQVPADEEYDEFEESSRHFLALANGEPCGTARWRQTPKGIKLERFAVRQAFRGQGVGRALVRAVLDDVFRHHAQPELVYMHAQVSAMPLYTGFGFEPVGDLFDECGIMHYKMVLPQTAYPVL
ncbi:GNAT family N-acetyltransferase [Nibrella saemangeumensis]|uniref:GNAT family N-acetyltransferase n=1 Tax=Nibrella saemangeumensis TaxID=1084526 RepID=A0ABP8MH44_9BACT